MGIAGPTAEPAIYLLTAFMAQLRSRGLARAWDWIAIPNSVTITSKYRQVLWLAQHRTPALQAAAEPIVDVFRLHSYRVSELGPEAQSGPLLVSAGYLVRDE